MARATTRRKKTVEQRLTEIVAWQIKHETEDRKHFSELEDRLAQLPTLEQIEALIRKVMLEVLFQVGKGTKGFLVGAAALTIAIGVLTGALGKITSVVGAIIGLSK